MTDRELVDSLFCAALAAVDPFRALLPHLRRVRELYLSGGFDRLVVAGFGKAALPMARAAEENIRDMEDNIASGVRVAWLNANYASEKVQLTAKLLQHANIAFDLAQARYKVGASSIVELSQAQLNKTSAEIAVAGAKYDYLTQRSFLSYQVGTLR